MTEQGVDDAFGAGKVCTGEACIAGGADCRVVAGRTAAAVAKKNSSVAGANTVATIGRPSSTKAAEIVQSARPAMKARVPSIGSITHTRLASSRAGSSSTSSDSQA